MKPIKSPSASPCDVETIGKCMILVTNKKLSIKLVGDDCDARGQAWPLDPLSEAD